MGLCIINGSKTLTPPEVVSNETLSRHNLYGIVFNGTGNQGKPLYNAIDQKLVPATPTSPGVDTWKNLAPFNVRKCITDMMHLRLIRERFLLMREIPTMIVSRRPRLVIG